jgi:serine protease Do
MHFSSIDGNGTQHMQQTTKLLPAIHRYIFRMAWLLLIISIFYTFVPGRVSAHNSQAPGGNVTDPTIRNVDLAQPSVVRIITGVKGHLKVHFSSNTDVTFPQQPNNSYDIRVSGTGTFISAHGDILTADHVVRPPADTAQKTALYQAAATDIANYLNQNGQQGKSQVQAQAIVQQLSNGQLQSSATFDDPQSTVYLSTAYTGLTHASDTSTLPNGTASNVDTIKQESAPDQEDTAIIHIPLEDSLSVLLGNSSNVQSLDKLTTIGFPGNSDVGNSPDSLLTASVNQVYVNAQKTNNNNAPLIQVTGNVSQGDSGGPALDEQGQIVGIVSFGVSANPGANNTSFLQASSSAQKMVQNLKLDTTPGQQQKLWSQALNSYASTSSGHWHQAEQEFAQLLQKYPNFKAAQQYYSYAQTQAKNEAVSVTTPVPAGKNKAATTTPFSWQALALTIVSLLGVLLLAVGTFSTALHQKKKPGRQRPAFPSSSSTAGKETITDNAPARSVGISSATLPSSTKPSGGSQDTLSLKIWPCGHMNRLNARFCSTCGEPAPEAESKV